MTSPLLPRPLPTLAKALKPATPPAPKAAAKAVAPKAPVKSAAKQVATAATGFAPSQTPVRRLALEAALPQLALPRDTPSFRVPNGIVPTKAQHLTPSLELARGSAAEALRTAGAVASLGQKSLSLKGDLKGAALLSGGLGAATALKLKLATQTGALDAASGRRNLDGATPAAATSDDARVQQPAERVEQAYARGGAEAGAKALEEEAQALGSPELVDPSAAWWAMPRSARSSTRSSTRSSRTC